jgi:nucleotide-binding universal stress UspA family protein
MSRTYIAGYDGSDAAKAALRFASRLAAETGGEVIAADVYVQAPFIAGKGAADGAAAAIDEQLRKESEKRLAHSGVSETIRLSVGAGSVSEGLHRLAEDQDAALVAVGVTHHGKLGRVVPGSVGEHLLHGAPCPIAVVPADQGDAPVRTVAVAYDQRPESTAALAYAEDLARRLGARLLVIAVHEPLIAYAAPGVPYYSGEMDDDLRQRLQQRVDGLVQDLGDDLDAAGRVHTGPAADTILRTCEQEDVDLLVMGSRGYGPVRSVLLGSVARALVDRAPCPVIVIPRGASTETREANEQAAAQPA